jgi:hypothetical protein
MKEICQTSCSIWQDRKLQRIPISLASQDEKFYEFVANNATGHPIDFDRFDGYVSSTFVIYFQA